MALLPSFQSNDRIFQMLQTRWASILNPVLSNPVTNPILLTNITLSTGANVINHTLGKMQQGWIITDINAAVTVYRSATFNDKTLTLTSSGNATINLLVY